jgi:hypothetical protein
MTIERTSLSSACALRLLCDTDARLGIAPARRAEDFEHPARDLGAAVHHGSSQLESTRISATRFKPVQASSSPLVRSSEGASLIQGDSIAGALRIARARAVR